MLSYTHLHRAHAIQHAACVCEKCVIFEIRGNHFRTSHFLLWKAHGAVVPIRYGTARHVSHLFHQCACVRWFSFVRSFLRTCVGWLVFCCYCSSHQSLSCNRENRWCRCCRRLCRRKRIPFDFLPTDSNITLNETEIMTKCVFQYRFNYQVLWNANSRLEQSTHWTSLCHKILFFIPSVRNSIFSICLLILCTESIRFWYTISSAIQQTHSIRNSNDQEKER